MASTQRATDEAVVCFDCGIAFTAKKSGKFSYSKAKDSLSEHFKRLRCKGILPKEDGILICDECGIEMKPENKRFSQLKVDMIQHVRRHHLKTLRDPVLFCFECESKFYKRSNLLRHYRDFHLERAEFGKFDLSENVRICDRCDQSFHCGTNSQIKRSLADHFNRVHFKTKESKASAEQKMDCFDCGKSFKSRSRFIRHYKTRHSSLTPEFRCFQCSSQFNYKRLLTTHISGTHNQNPGSQYICDICEKEFSSEVYVRVHISCVHHQFTANYAFECNYCSKVFPHIRSFQQHKRRKHNEKPGSFQCSILRQNI